MVSGPDRVYFADSRQAITTGSLNTPGTYVLRFAANDGQLSAVDEVTIAIASPTNRPPFVFAGFNLETTRPAAAELWGTVLDDGLPAGYPLSVSWSKVSGPGSVAFSPSANQALSSAVFGAPGLYVLRLTASDSQFTELGEIEVTVHEGTNQPPLVDAGPDLVISLPNPAILQTSASDEGLPDGTLEVSWEQVDGPDAAYLSTVNGTYQASFNTPGGIGSG